MTDRDLVEAVEAAIAPLTHKIECLEIEVRELKQGLQSDTPQVLPQAEAAKALHLSPSTLQRRRADWIEGVHWWKDKVSDRPYYNVFLIQDGIRQGFDSAAHHRVCNDWVKTQQPSKTKRAS